MVHSMSTVDKHFTIQFIYLFRFLNSPKYPLVYFPQLSKLRFILATIASSSKFLCRKTIENMAT